MPTHDDTRANPTTRNDPLTLERALSVSLPLNAPLSLRWTVGWLLAAGCIYAFAAFLIALIEAVTRPSLGGLPGITLLLGTAAALAHAVTVARRSRPRRPLTHWISALGSIGLATFGVASIPGMDPVTRVFIPAAIALAALWLILSRLASHAGRHAIDTDAPAPRWSKPAAALAIIPMLAPVIALIIIGP